MSISANKKLFNGLAIAATLLICYIPLCHRINSNCIHLWDEGRNVTNAIEMLHNHKWLTRYFETQPDMWELKPPFLVWCQALSLKIFGFNELGARFPSMVFSMSTVLLLIWMGFKITGKIHSGIIASLVLATSMGYIGEHGARYGDHEATIAFFTTALVCFAWLFFTLKQTKYLVLCFIAVFFGWFTKSIVIFMFIPFLFCWALANKQIKEIVTGKVFWLGLLTLCGAIFIYYLLREKSSPGYIQLVWKNEFFGRYFGDKGDYVYEKDYWYYLKGFIFGRFLIYFLVFVIGIEYVLIKNGIPHRKFLVYLLLTFLTFSFIISTGTKNSWYDIPLYPIASLFIGILAVQFYYQLKKIRYRLAFGSVFFLIIYSQYADAWHYVFSLEIKNTENRTLAYFLKDESDILPKHLKIIHDGYYSPLHLYVEKARTKNKFITLSKTVNLEVNDTFLITSDKLIQRTDNRFYTKTILEKEGSVLKVVTGLKN